MVNDCWPFGTNKLRYTQYILSSEFLGHKIGIVQVSDCQAYVLYFGTAEVEKKVY